MFNNAEVGRAFHVHLIQSPKMETALQKWDDISTGKPAWLNPEDGVKTVNMAKHIADTRAKLITLDLGIAVSGNSARAEYLQEICDDLLKRLPDRVKDAVRMGGMMLKYNGQTWDFILPGDFGITKMDSNGEIVGAIFAQHIIQGNEHFTRLEYHRFEGDLYIVTNRAFKNRATLNNDAFMLGSEVPLNSVDEWAEMQEEARIQNLEKPLFAYFRVPGVNHIDPSSPLGLSVFANAITELEAIDMAISRKDTEVEDSKHVTFVGQAVIKGAQNQRFKLPRFVKGLGMNVDDTGNAAIREHVPTLQTEARIKDINFDLSLAGVKCGFSEGVFVLDGQTGMITATQVEADDRDTIQTIKDDRDALQAAIEQAVYGADALATLLNLAPAGEYEIAFSFGDITYNYEEDKANWKSYVLQGWVPVWKYLVKFEKMTEEDAKALAQEVAQERLSMASLFPQQE